MKPSIFFLFVMAALLSCDSNLMEYEHLGCRWDISNLERRTDGSYYFLGSEPSLDGPFYNISFHEDDIKGRSVEGSFILLDEFTIESDIHVKLYETRSEMRFGGEALSEYWVFRKEFVGRVVVSGYDFRNLLLGCE